jgi:hypothetical protein
MSTSLRDQLLKAGLVSEKQAQEAERRQQQQQKDRQHLPKPKRNAPSESQQAVARAQAAKVAADQDINRKRQRKAEKQARLAQILQLVEQNRLPPLECDEAYHFVDHNKVRRIRADAATRARLGRGEIAIVRCKGQYALVPASIAERIRERDATAVIVDVQTSAAAGATSDADTESSPKDAYSDFIVPDDLIW